MRVAFFHTELSRPGPGLMLRDIRQGHDQVEAIASVVRHIDPDVLVLADIDYDLQNAGLQALADHIGGYPYLFSRRPNRGLDSQRDLNGDDRLGGPKDVESYAEFFGQGGMGVLSKRRLDLDHFRDFSDMPWATLPGNIALQDGRDPTRLSRTVHWDLPLRLADDRRLHLLIWHATAPVFDGPEDRNGRRNHDETAFWLSFFDGALAADPPPGFVLLGVTNADPFDGESRPQALRRLLQHPKVHDPKPSSEGARAAGDPDHRGPPELDTVDWPSGTDRPGNLRVDYVLPSSNLTVENAGVVWPLDGMPLSDDVRLASRHRLVWVDIYLPKLATTEN